MSHHHFDDILTNITVDHLCFQVTWNPYEQGSVILWCRDQLSDVSFFALGKFMRFDKRAIIEFVARYLTNPNLREQIRRLQFERRLASMSLSFFDQIELLAFRDKEKAYRSLFSLDGVPACKKELAIRRRTMAKRFHPDAGGDTRAMSLINEAYDYLASRMDK